MRLVTIISLFSLWTLTALAQSNNPWTAFWDEEGYLMGFKDQEGKVMIEPKFMGFTTADRFRNIIAVMEETDSTYRSYYLLKNGKEIGEDSVHVWDMTFDCEREGTIRFRDKITDKVGYFDSLGQVMIPAQYNEALPFHNGLAIALTGAKRVCWDGEEYSAEEPCEHWSWEGGKSMLINKKNEVLIDSFDYTYKYYWNSFLETEEPHPDTLRTSFKGTNGNYYSFIDIEKHFGHWLRTELIENWSQQKLIEYTYPTITWWDASEGWVTDSSSEFIRNNFEVIESRMMTIREKGADYFYSIEDLNQFMFEGEEFERYFDDCGEPQSWKYPVMSLIVNDDTEEGLKQDHFSFLKTEEGYRLLSVTIRD